MQAIQASLIQHCPAASALEPHQRQPLAAASAPARQAPRPPLPLPLPLSRLLRVL